ncbi:hypothetical protein [Marinibactrum halimedae]|nr:hypothetical protein [Marinibactrum halimedae]
MSASINTEQVNSINRVAIVGFDTFKMSSGEGLSIGAIMDMTKSKESISNLGEKFYIALGDQLGKEMGWQVLSIDSVKGNPYYQELYQSARGKTKTRLINGRSVTTEGIAPAKPMRELTKAQKDKLIKSLNVDSIIFMDSLLAPGKTSSIMGTFSFEKYRVTVDTFTMHNIASNTPIIEIKRKVGDTPDKVRSNFSIAGFSTNPSQKEIGLVYAIKEVAKALAEEIKKGGNQ